MNNKYNKILEIVQRDRRVCERLNVDLDTFYSLDLRLKMTDPEWIGPCELENIGGEGISFITEEKIPVDDIVKSNKNIRQAVDVGHGMLVVKVRGQGRAVLKALSRHPKIQTVPMVAAVSEDVQLDNLSMLIWGLFTRFDCHRDTFFRKVKIGQGHPVVEGPLFIDATWKKGYPQPLKMTPDVVKRVDQRWREYAIKC